MRSRQLPHLQLFNKLQQVNDFHSLKFLCFFSRMESLLTIHDVVDLDSLIPNESLLNTQRVFKPTTIQNPLPFLSSLQQDTLVVSNKSSYVFFPTDIGDNAVSLIWP